MQKSIVFLGPSLERRVADSLFVADYRPPAKRGDIARAAADHPDLILLIDGVFHQESAVSHREILAAIQKGITVIGAASMGALRAAELDTLGMIGIGEIYRLYKSGCITSDDEVALIFDPETGIALSEPLINIRYTLNQALSHGIIREEVKDTLFHVAQSLFYPERTYPHIVAQASAVSHLEPQYQFLQWVKEQPYDLKREDTLRALEYAEKRIKNSLL